MFIFYGSEKRGTEGRTGRVRKTEKNAVDKRAASLLPLAGDEQQPHLPEVEKGA